jgi:hypothetical protein
MFRPLLIGMCFWGLFGLIGLLGILFEKTWIIEHHWLVPFITFGLAVVFLLVLLGISITIQEIFGSNLKKLGWVFSILWLAGLLVFHYYVNDPVRQSQIKYLFFAGFIIYWFLIYMALAWGRRGQNSRRLR